MYTIAFCIISVKKQVSLLVLLSEIVCVYLTYNTPNNPLHTMTKHFIPYYYSSQNWKCKMCVDNGIETLFRMDGIPFGSAFIVYIISSNNKYIQSVI